MIRALPAGPSAPAEVNIDVDGRAAALARSYELMRAAPAGAKVADYLATSDVDIRVMDDDEYDAQYPGTGGNFRPALQRLSIPEATFGSMPYAATVMAHEGQHALDAKSRISVFATTARNLATGSLDGVRALAHGGNPLSGWIDGYQSKQLEWEVSGYRTQAQVANALGLRQGSWAHGQARDGSVLPDEQIRTRIEADSLYQLAPNARLLIGGAAGMLGTLAVSSAVGAITSRLAPASWLARHPSAVTVGGAVLTGALLLADRAGRSGDGQVDLVSSLTRADRAVHAHEDT